MVSEVDQPGGATGGNQHSITHFTYNLSIQPGVANTRIVSDPRSDIPPTTYTLNPYGAVTRISAPDGAGLPNSTITRMVWATPETPHPEAFLTATPGSHAAAGVDVELVSTTDALGRTTSYEYDSLGNVVKQTISFAGIRTRASSP